MLGSWFFVASNKPYEWQCKKTKSNIKKNKRKVIEQTQQKPHTSYVIYENISTKTTNATNPDIQAISSKPSKTKIRFGMCESTTANTKKDMKNKKIVHFLISCLQKSRIRAIWNQRRAHYYLCCLFWDASRTRFLHSEYTGLTDRIKRMLK